MPFPPLMMPPIANTFQAPNVDPWGRAPGATELDIPDFGDPEAFQGSSLLELYYHLLQPRRQRVSQKSGPYSYSGPSRHSTVPPENLAAAKQLLQQIMGKEEADRQLERQKIADDIIRGGRGPGTGEMTMTTGTEPVPASLRTGDQTMSIESPARGAFSEAEVGQMFAGGYIPTGTRGIPPGAPGGNEPYPQPASKNPTRLKLQRELAFWTDRITESEEMLKQQEIRNSFMVQPGDFTRSQKGDPGADLKASIEDARRIQEEIRERIRNLDAQELQAGIGYPAQNQLYDLSADGTITPGR